MGKHNEQKIAMKAIIDAEIFQLMPVLMEAEKAKETFYSHPSTQTGARRWDAEVAANHAIDNAASRIWERWNARYSQNVDMDEVKNDIHDSIVEYVPQGEGEFWVGKVGKKLEVAR